MGLIDVSLMTAPAILTTANQDLTRFEQGGLALS